MASSNNNKSRPLPQLWLKDEEMAKKDDDHHRLAAKHPAVAATAAAATALVGGRPPRPACVMRVVAYVVIAAVVALVVLRGLSFGEDRRGFRFPERGRPGSALDKNDRHHEPRPDPPAPPQAPPRAPPQATGRDGVDEGTDQVRSPSDRNPNNQVPIHTEAPLPKDYSGPIKQPQLIESLRAITAVSQGSARNRNVLFAAASLSSAATLLPMACQMAMSRLNNVHFVLVGRDDIPIQDLLEINGIDAECSLSVHDGRPDSAASSSNRRMTLAVERALAAIHRVAHPQAVLIDATDAEEPFLQRAARRHSNKVKLALIELPEKPHSRLAWISKLDTSALSAWNKVRFDIVVHTSFSSGPNVQRLLQSISRVDFGGHSVPHLVVELPSKVDPSLQRFLADFSWPPPYPGGKPMPSMLSLRRRITLQKLTEEESSVRFLESFWPSDPRHSHVLVLSPRMEVGPHFFHCTSSVHCLDTPLQVLTRDADIKYSLLVQRHSKASFGKDRQANMMAMSLNVPNTILGSSDHPFEAPEPPRESDASPDAGTAFLWQAPVSDALLFMGDKWIELHGYVSKMLERQPAASDSPPAIVASKEVGNEYPAWMEYALQLSRLRGYTTLFPSRQIADALAGAHTDLPEQPEEYQGQAGAGDREGDAFSDEASVEFEVGSQVDMLETLPGGAPQQPLHRLPLLSWRGKQAKDGELHEEATRFRTDFRRQVGRCGEEELAKPTLADEKATDLFCQLGNEDKETE